MASGNRAIAASNPKRAAPYRFKDGDPGEAEELASRFRKAGMGVPDDIAAAAATSKKSIAKKTAKEKVPASADGKLNLKLKDPALSTNFISEPDKFDPIFTKKMRFRNLPPKAASSRRKLDEERSYIKKIIEEVYDEVLSEEGWFEPHI